MIKTRPEEDLDSGWGDDEDSDAPPSSGASAAGKDLDAGSDEIDEGWDDADLPPAPQPKSGIVPGRTSRSKKDGEVARAKAETKAKKRSAKKAERRAEREALRLASQKKPQKARAGGVAPERADQASLPAASGTRKAVSKAAAGDVAQTKARKQAPSSREKKRIWAIAAVVAVTALAALIVWVLRSSG